MITSPTQALEEFDKVSRGKETPALIELQPDEVKKDDYVIVVRTFKDDNSHVGRSIFVREIGQPGEITNGDYQTCSYTPYNFYSDSGPSSSLNQMGFINRLNPFDLQKLLEEHKEDRKYTRFRIFKIIESAEVEVED